MGPNPGDTRPSAFLNYILFDQNYKALDMGWTIIPTSANFAKQQMTIPQVTVKEAGYIFVYLSYEDQSNNYVYFDDFKVTHTKGNVIQSNEYYPFGMQTASSWTRDNVTGNNFLGNGGTELNTTSQVYDLDYRNYDPILGRMNQTDPLADQFSSLSPYHYSYNNPVGFNDPSGALPWSADFAESYTGSDYGSRNAWAKMVAHGGMAQFVGGAGEGWDGYVGGFGLAENGFGVGASEPGPTVYSPWCGCRVSAFEVMSQDPTNQNASFRAKAQSAVDSYLAGSTGPNIASQDATRVNNNSAKGNGSKSSGKRFTPGLMDAADWYDNLSGGKLKGVPGSISKGQDIFQIFNDANNGNNNSAYARGIWFGLGLLFEYEVLVAEGAIKLGQTDMIQYGILQNSLDEYRQNSGQFASYMQAYQQSGSRDQGLYNNAIFWGSKADKSMQSAMNAYRMLNRDED